MYKLDINNAFLYGFLDEEVYMDPPEGLFGFEFTALLVYVDDILLIGSSEVALQSVKEYLDKLFTIKDLGHGKYFLSLELARSSYGIHVTQHKYLQDILADSSMLDTKPTPITLPSRVKMTADNGSLLSDLGTYRRLVHPPLVFSFLLLGRDNSVPTLMRPGNRVWILVVPSLVFVSSLGHLSSPAALHIIANPIFHESTKHLDIDCHLVRDQFKLGFVSPSHISGCAQVADLFTKSLTANDFALFLPKLGLSSSAPS
ncbi:UNVERIFIED_CONTAM: Retrovirus-related Pol polyprotein from transposon RE1 [Sesamum indicum]